MQHVIRFTLTLLLATTLNGVALVKTAPKEAEYKRADMNFYWKGDVAKADPTAVIFTGKYTQKGDSYFIMPKKKAPQELYIQVINDWIEPITPPNMPASLGVPPDAMQIREPQGDVQVAFPSAPATFLPATDGMTIPNGAVVKTGGNGTAAVLFGGVASARLTPNSEAAMQQTVTAQSRSTEVDLTRGAVFSKVGQRIGEKEDYQVKTPFGVAAARGTDFVTIAMPARTDVWIAQGTVQLNQTDGKLVGTVKSEGTGALKLIRFPVMADPHQTMMANAETMTMAMNFIPMADVKLKALHDKVAQGVKLTPTEQDYLGRIKKVPSLIKLALVEPPAPVPVAPAAVVKPAPAPTAPVKPAPSATLKPFNLHLRPDGTVGFQHGTFTLDALKPKLAAIAKATPDQPFVIKAGKKTTAAQIAQVTQLCHDAGLKTVIVTQPMPPPAPAAPLPAPPAPMATPTPKPLPPAMELPMNLDLRPDGKVDFQGATVSLDELKIKLEEVSVVMPGQPLMVTGGEKVTHQQLKKVVAICRDANLTRISIVNTAPATSVPTPSVAPSGMAASSQVASASPMKTSAAPNPAVSHDAEAPVPLATGPGDTVP